jgi:hypothetical protein
LRGLEDCLHGRKDIIEDDGLVTNELFLGVALQMNDLSKSHTKQASESETETETDRARTRASVSPAAERRKAKRKGTPQ